MSASSINNENDLPDLTHKKRQTSLGSSSQGITGNQRSADTVFYELFKNHKHDLFDVPQFLKALSHCGLRYENDPRFAHMMSELKDIEQQMATRGNVDIMDVTQLYLNMEQFQRVTSKAMPIIVKALQNQFVIPDWDSFVDHVKDIYASCKDMDEGEVAKNIPQLAKADPNWFDVSICTVDGQRYSLGNGNRKICLQSISMAFSYAIALNELGADEVHKYVGTEPSGRAYNEICLDNNRRPHNPLINAGAVLICSMIKSKQQMSERFDFVSDDEEEPDTNTDGQGVPRARLHACTKQVMDQFEKLAGGEYVGFNNSVFLSERKCSDRNFALAYYLREHNAFPEKVALNDAMDLYFQMQSIESSIDSLAVMGATLANGGVNPLSGQRLLNNQACRDTLSLMYSCGMYEYSGMFAFKVGLPAKASVAGATILVVPNVAAFTIYSPRLNCNNNSVRGVAFSDALVGKFNFHNYDSMLMSESEKVDPRRSLIETQGQQLMNILFAAKTGDLNAIKRYILQGMDVTIPDYDGRTVLHLAAAEGHWHVLKFLVQKWQLSPNVKDRWGNTPMNDAVTFSHPECVSVLEQAANRKPSSAQKQPRKMSMMVGLVRMEKEFSNQ